VCDSRQIRPRISQNHAIPERTLLFCTSIGRPRLRGLTAARRAAMVGDFGVPEVALTPLGYRLGLSTDEVPPERLHQTRAEEGRLQPSLRLREDRKRDR
jgi:hypothetical protein